MALEKCRECEKQISSEAKSCPHCGCPDPIYKEPPPEEPTPTKCRICGKNVSRESKHCASCGHPQTSTRGSLTQCRKCRRDVSTESPSCPKCNIPLPYIEFLPYVLCRESGCRSVVHKLSKKCTNCGCPDPAGDELVFPTVHDFAKQDWLIKHPSKGTIKLTTKEVFDKMSTSEIGPSIQLTINLPFGDQIWKPADYYLPFSGGYHSSGEMKQSIQLVKAAFAISPAVAILAYKDPGFTSLLIGLIFGFLWAAYSYYWVRDTWNQKVAYAYLAVCIFLIAFFSLRWWYN